MTTLGPPPLPIVNDVVAIVSFLADSLDDLVEDAAKLAMLWFVGWIVWRVLSGARRLLSVRKDSSTRGRG